MTSPFDQAALVYCILNFKGKPHHLSQLGSQELYASMLSVRSGRGCHLHVTSVYYPNVPALCIQMEAFILLLLGLHPSNVHLTGIQMSPRSCCLWLCDRLSHLDHVTSLGVLANRPMRSGTEVVPLWKSLSRWGFSACTLIVWWKWRSPAGFMMHNISC